MAETIQKSDFIELEYTGKIKEDGLIFDTTNADEAKKAEIFNENAVYGKITVCIGQQQILAGVDKQLEGKETEKEYDLELSAEQGFGKKRSDLLKIVPSSIFKKQKINPMPGLQLNIDGAIGTVRTVSGGRTIVDFNHPLASKELQYHVKIGKKVNDKKEQILSYLSLGFNIKKDAFDVKVEVDKAIITLNGPLPAEVQKELAKNIKEVIKIKDIEFKAKTADMSESSGSEHDMKSKISDIPKKEENKS